MAQSELPKPGDLIGVRYRIESLLGQGGMGAVFAAVNQATGRAVAIKWMLPGAARSKESLARFLAEARATARIEHPNVIQILDVGQDGDAPFLVMERLRGESLAERLKRAGRMTPDEALRMLIPACKGLAEAHSEGIIHRDIKPDNIFLCQGKDGSPRPPKVLDFGISKLYDEDSQGAPMTRTGIAMGTPWYMSPEQLNAPPTADARFDVYAMGVVLYECLTGRPPYDAEGLFELVQQIAAGNPTSIRALAPDVPPDLEAVTMRAMAADREVRYPTMKEFVAELERIQARMHGGAPAPHVPFPPTGPMGPHGHTPAPSTGPVGSWGPAATPGHGAGAPTPHGYGTPGGGYGTPPGGPGIGTAPTMAAPAARGGGGSKGLIVVAAVAVLGLGFLGLVGAGVAWLLIGGDEGGSTGGPTTPVVGGGGSGPVVGGGPATGGGDNPRDPNIEVTFSGACSPTFDARRMVTSSAGAVNVISSGMGGVTGSIMMQFPNLEPGGTVQLSTQHRMDTQTAINVMQGQQLWTNMTMDTLAVQRGRIEDPISGSMTIREWDPELARVDITFHQVSLQNMRNGNICTMNGRLRTFGTTYGM
ncbi:MAG TPA: serine/threonine-protein kinase [Sandaracinaceae bacterium LLY-WYZ-13_1]|nr:serine/threonine-protein kinase [Sandaracinaceae bacterium LLY-WYZ-13_1]